MKTACKKQKIVSHFVGLSGVGGDQSNFIEYMNNIKLHPSKYKHKVYTIGSVDSCYRLDIDVLDIKKVSNLYKLALDIISKGVIVHFYNNLSSLKVAFFLFFLPVNKLIVHERGTIWNQKFVGLIASYIVSWKAHIILSNSFATKTMLIKKVHISEKKIQVLHNGINTLPNQKCNTDCQESDSTFYIGFIGRLDSPKGVHILIDAMKHLKSKNIKLIIAGDGALKKILKINSSKLPNVKFIGRVKTPYIFMSKINLLVVPSIREPLGNVCLEAGLCKVPVLAANIDGLPEIIEDKFSGELIDATDQAIVNLAGGALPLPKFVVNPDTQKLYQPRQINPAILAKRILGLSQKPDKLRYYANNLHNKDVKYFNINRYRTELHKIYSDMFF